jgi:hypothetical protein
VAVPICGARRRVDQEMADARRERPAAPASTGEAPPQSTTATRNLRIRGSQPPREMHDLFAQDCWNASSFACALCLHLVRKRGYMQMQIGMLAGDSLTP